MQVFRFTPRSVLPRFTLHDAPGAGHLGVDKTLEKARQLGYWVSMYGT